MQTKKFIVSISRKDFTMEFAFHIFNDIVDHLKDFKISMKKQTAHYSARSLTLHLESESVDWVVLLNILDKTLSRYSSDYQKDFSIQIQNSI